jgi:membrane-bound serine protease (ClpP class)
VKHAILHLLAFPDAAVLVLLAGILFVYLECNRPGSILPGCLGTLLILLSVDSLCRMPLRSTALALLASGLALLLIEIAVNARNLLAGAGILALIAGLASLLQPFAPARVHIPTAFVAGAGFGISTLYLAKIALRARRNKRSRLFSNLSSSPTSAKHASRVQDRLDPSRSSR